MQLVSLVLICSSWTRGSGLQPPRGPGTRGRRFAAGDGDGGAYKLPQSLVPLVGSYALGVATPAVVSRCKGGGTPARGGGGGSSGAGASLGDFTGKWKLDRSENFDAYLKSLNVSATHRRIAAGASVTHDIDHAERDRPKICVINRLGKKCETVKVGETISSTDTYGNPNTKTTSWAKDGVTMLTTIDSTVGRVMDVRKLEDRDTMVMVLTSPSGVTGKRVFRRVDGPAPGLVVTATTKQAAGIGAGAVAFSVGLAASGFLLGRKTSPEAAPAPAPAS